MLGPVYKYNIPYKMASEYMYKTKLRGWKQNKTNRWGFLYSYHLKLKNFGPE